MKNPVTIRVETEVELDVALMAKTFAHMGSDEQAKFLSLVHREMGEYTREHRDGTTATLGSYGREMQMLSIKDQLDKQPDAREFIRTLYEMTMVEDEPEGFVLPVHREATTAELISARNYANKVLEKRGITNVVNTAGEVMEAATLHKTPGDVEQAKAILGGAGHFNWDNPPGDMLEDLRKAKATIKADTGLYPTQWIMSGEQERRWLAAANMAPNVFVTCDPSKLNIVGSLAHTCDGGTYIGRVVEWKSDGMVVIEVAPGVKPPPPVDQQVINVAPGVFDKDGKAIDNAILDAVSRNKKAVGELLVPDELAAYTGPFDYSGVSLNDDTAPNVAERRQCEECKGTGTWTNPFNDETTPCSRGCKS